MNARLVRGGLIAVAVGAVALALISGPVDTAADGVDPPKVAPSSAGAAPAASAAAAGTSGDAVEPVAALADASAEPAAGPPTAAGASAAAATANAAASAAAVAAVPDGGASAARRAAAPAAASAPLQATASAPKQAAAPLQAVAPASAASAGVAAAAGSAASAAALAAARTRPCRVLASRLPNLTETLCESARLRPSGWHSVDGFPLFQRDVTAAPQAVAVGGGSRAPRRLRVLVLGAIHGDEISSASLVFHWIAQAVDTGAEMDWRFVPALNPDGLLRKSPTRTNSRGIDLNRNFPTPHWHPDALEYWTKRTKQDVRRYPGPEPLSEPESRFVTHTIDHWKPDAIVSVHAPFGVLDYDGPSTPPARLGRLFLDRVGIYPGSLGNYGGAHRGVPVVTIELPSAIRTPTDAEMRQMWIDLLRWMGERLTPIER